MMDMAQTTEVVPVMHSTSALSPLVSVVTELLTVHTATASDTHLVPLMGTRVGLSALLRQRCRTQV